MDFSLSPDQAALCDLVDELARKELRPTAFDQRQGHERPPERNIRLLADAGILGLTLPFEYGGADRPDLEGVLAIERVSRACPVSGEYALMCIAGPPTFIAKWGTDAQKARYLPPIAAGRELGSVSLTEPEAGTDLAALRTRAEIRGDVCLVNGQKTFCSWAPRNEWYLVFVRFGPGPAGIGAVIVDRDTPGLTFGKVNRHMSGAPWSELYFDNAEVPAANVLFDGNGFRQLMSSYSLERSAAGAWVLGIAQLAFDLALSYVEERQQFGRRLSDFQMIQARLANCYVALEGARLLVYRAVQGSDGGVAARLASSAAKLSATEAACFVTDQAMQIHGGSGMSQEMPLEWLYRTVRPATVAGGTSDIHRSMIASELVGRRFEQR